MKIKFSKKLDFDILDRTNPGYFLNNYLGYENVDPKKFYKDFIKNMTTFFKKKNTCEWQEVIETNKSYKKLLFWQIIIIPPYTKFSLHAHPNIEYSYIAEGTLYEIRCKYNIYNGDYYIKNRNSPDISNLVKNDFIFNEINKSTVLINDGGSVHLSYTKLERCVIYCLWTGMHVHIDSYPEFFDDFDPKK